MPEAPSSAAPHVTFERPVPARLIVRLDNGEEWEPDDDDLERFGYRSKAEITRRYLRWCVENLGTDDLGHGPLNALRYVFECAIHYDEMPGQDTADQIKGVLGAE